MDKTKKRALPELLAPAGSPRALLAAIDAGADAVYFGARGFNARIGADNFSEDELAFAFEKCHAYGVKSYVTLNTLALDRELTEYLKTAERVYELGADAIIIADLGGASVIKKYYPEIELHASTQFSGHNASAAIALSELGFTRMVLARETSLRNIKLFTESSPIEAEIFVHGALCVSHSGQCLFSSVVGGRSGNRGQCAQPCRLPYSDKNSYPLSLKDLCLAPHIPEIIESGVASLKIEGRMKSPEYVHAVTKTYRRLLDEKRGASSDEMKYLSSVFSRGGFTDGYFSEHISRAMLGVRSKSDKDSSKALAPFSEISRKIPISISAKFCMGMPSVLTMKREEKLVTITGDVPFEAINAPMTRDIVLKCLSKLGDTPFVLEDAEIEIEGNIMLPIGKLNQLRRSAADALIGSSKKELAKKEYKLSKAKERKADMRSARFNDPSAITDLATEYFDRIYLPLHKYSEKANGVILPPVIFDGDREKVRQMLCHAKELGAKYALVGNLGHLALAREADLLPIGDFRLNIFNRESAKKLMELGFESFIASPELTLPQLRDIGEGRGAIVYGRLPLMLLEKCVIKELSGCAECARDRAVLKDRRGTIFPVLREWDHRNTVYNSLPTYMGDKKALLWGHGIENLHFIFSTENSDEVDRVINSFKDGKPLGSAVRRIKE